MERILTLTDIPRVKAGTSSKSSTKLLGADDPDRALLAQRAADLLGYHALRADVTGERSVSATSGKLTEVLLRLEIDTLDAASVIDYQMEEVTRRTKEVIYERFKDWTTGWFTVASWTRTSLPEYERPIPEFVLDKALRIKEALPDVQFFIQHMTDPKADPFLIANLGKEIYYIEAWDEPRFEGRSSVRSSGPFKRFLNSQERS